MSARAEPGTARAATASASPVRMSGLRPLASKVGGLVVLVACVTALAMATSLGEPVRLMRNADPASLALALFFILLATWLSYQRMRAAIGLFGFRPSHGVSTRAFLVGQVSNQLLANVIGQSLSRGAVLQAAGVPFSVSVFATFIERAVAAASLLALSLAAVLMLLGSIALDLGHGGFQLVSVAAGLLLAMLVLAAVLMTRHGPTLTRLCSLRQISPALGVLGLTLAAHAAMLAAYLAALAGLGIDISRPEIAGALLIVMFAASLPISFGGWGLRELSAAHALGLVGIPAATAVAGSALVGLLSLGATLFPVAVLITQRSRLRASCDVVAAGTRTDQTRGAVWSGAGWDRMLLWIASVLTASLIFFQVRVPLSAGEINVNAADIFALMALAIAVAVAILDGAFQRELVWVWRGLAWLSLLMLIGLAIGYANHGWSDWALMNRGLGWLVLVGYVVAGAAAGGYRGAEGRGTVLLVFAATGIAVCLAQIVLLEFDRFVVTMPRELLVYPLEGFARNRNAFAFQILLLLAALAVLARTGVIGWRAHAVGCGIALIVVWETLSRTGWILASMLIFALALTVERLERARFLLRLSGGLALVVVVYLSASYALASLSGTSMSGAMLHTVNLHEGVVMRPEADGERLQTLIGGLRLWLAHPLAGSGIGGYIAARAADGLPFQVIHSVPVWLLAELGLLGAALVSIVGFEWVDRARRSLRVPQTEPWAVGLLAIVMVLVVAGLVHDFLYQRTFWFLAGIFAAGMTWQPAARQET